MQSRCSQGAIKVQSRCPKFTHPHAKTKDQVKQTVTYRGGAGRPLEFYDRLMFIVCKFAVDRQRFEIVLNL